MLYLSRICLKSNTQTKLSPGAVSRSRVWADTHAEGQKRPSSNGAPGLVVLPRRQRLATDERSTAIAADEDSRRSWLGPWYSPITTLSRRVR
jgi:hypothetical protein